VRYASFFSGIGGFELALDAAGLQRVFSCEIDPFCNEVFRARWGHECESKDITALKPEEIPDADLWVGGFPCQDLSVAGRRGGIQANRSGLVWRFLELAAVRRPHRIWLENVPGLLSSKDGRDFGLLLREVEKLGYVGTWRVLDAQHQGVPQRRRRVFLVASLGADCGCEILLEPESGRRHPPKGREARKISTGEPTRSPEGVSGNQGRLAHGVSASKGHHGHSSPRRDGTDDLVVAEKAPAVDQNMNRTGNERTEAEKLVVGTLQSCAPGQGRKTPEVDQIAHAVSKSSGGSLGGRQGQDDYVVGALTSHKKSHGSEASSGQAAESGHIVAAPITSGSHPNSNAPGRKREDDENIVFTHQRAVTIPISSDALREGEAKTPSKDAEGKARIRDPGLGVGKEGDPSFTVNASTPPVAFQSTGGTRDIQAGEKSPPLKVGTSLGIPSPPAVAFTQNSRSEAGEEAGLKEASKGVGGGMIRRLTPT
jgi:DNA-cytosine methyltransferase